MVSTGGALPKKTTKNPTLPSVSQSGFGPYRSIPGVPTLQTVPSAVTAGLATPAQAAMAANPAKNPYLDPTFVASHPAAASTSGGGVPGGTVSATPGALNGNQSAWDASTGYAKKYSPDMLDTILNQHPEILSADVLKSLGINSTAYAGQLGQEAGVGQLVSFILQSLNNTDGSNNNTVNAVADYLKRRATPGGSTPDTQFLLNAILNSGPDSKIYQELGLGAASGAGSATGNPQANTNSDSVNNMIYGTLNDQNKYTQQATKNYLADQQSNYIRQLATNPQASPATYLDYLKNSQLSNWFGQ